MSDVDLLRAMLRIRVIEETLADHYEREQLMKTPVHFSIGQEAPAVGVCAALGANDVVLSGHRCHAHYLARGGDLRAMVAELYGRAAGCAGGRGGSVHLADRRAGLLGSTAILGETIAVAAGAAWAFALDAAPHVAVAFFGDGAIEEGIWHETLNFAAVKRLPVLFVCENNLYSTHTPLAVRQPESIPIAHRARSYGMPALSVDGNDVFQVQTMARIAVEEIRTEGGPQLLECRTYRWREHVGPLWDWDRGYRTREEGAAWMARCPILHAQRRLVECGDCTDDEVLAWRLAAQREIDAAIAWAQAQPWPEVA